MEGNNNFRTNPRRYENYLSGFGRKVLNVLILKWKSDQNTAQNELHRFSSSIQNRRILTFRPSASTSTLCKDIVTDSDFQGETPFDFNLEEQNKSHDHIPTTLQLVQAVGTNAKETIVDEHINISSNDLINSVNDNIVNDLNNRRLNSYLPDAGLPSDKADTNNSDDIDWDNMFDSELFSEVTTTNTKVVLKQIESPVKDTSKIHFPHETSKRTDLTLTKKAKHEKAVNIKSKRKNKAITDAIPKKVKKVSENTNVSFRKQKYTKTVKNWLEDVDAKNPVEKDEIVDRESEENEERDQAIMTVEKVTEKPNKKVIQAQLANKGGIMKFCKPKPEQTVKELKDNKVEESVKNIDENTIRQYKMPKEINEEKDFNKEKKNKPKFVAPIKSQLPVKDVEFSVTIVDENNIKNHLDTLKSMENKELVIVLVYSNGFSQLNNHHTADTCVPEGFLMSIADAEHFFYIKGDHRTNNDVFRFLFENNKIICYEGKAVLIYVKSKLELDIYNIEMIDAKIGGSLLDPDNPPENFSELQKLLSFTPQFTIATECALQKTAWYSTLLMESASRLTSLLIEEQLWNVFLKIEMKLLPIIAEMELRGVTVDLQKLKSMEDILLSKMKSRELECYKAAGKTFQINSPVQVRALIYDELKLDAKCNVKIRETLSKGAKSTSESMLRSLTSEHVLPKLILEYRHLHKAHATFLAGIAQHVKDGVVRPTWVQTAAATGRIASNNPNLQAIPKAPFSLVLFPDLLEDNDTDGPAVSMRCVYGSRAGYSLLAADFQQVECRVFAHAAADDDLRAALHNSDDLFRVLAHNWLQKPPARVSACERARTKRVVYASLYGAGARRLAELLDVGHERARAVIASFNNTFPCLKRFVERVVARARGGRLTTASGRARRLPHLTSGDDKLRAQAERQAVNFIVQGSAADLCKMAMIVTSEQLRAHSPPLDGHLLLQIHDELVWEIRDQHLPTAAAIIKRAMEGCGHHAGVPVTLPVSLSVGHDWGNMTDYRTSLQ